MSGGRFYSTTRKAVANAHVLVIDDDRDNYTVLKSLLKKANIHNTSYAGHMEKAFEIIRQKPPQIILLDIMMPDISGFDFCEKLKQMPAYANIPVIFISALRGADIRAKAFNLGGVDYLQKPYDHNETRERIKVHLQNGLLMNALESQAETMRQEMELGAHVQKTLLPAAPMLEEICQRHNCQISSAFVPSGTLAGDFWQILPVDDNHFAIAVCDYSGHGVASALETARFHSLIHELKPLWQRPANLIQALNERLYRMLQPETFATFTYALINSQTRTGQVLSAGGPSFLHIEKSNSTARLYHAPSLPLGTTPHWETDKKPWSLNFGTGDGLVFYSDALTELPLKDARFDPLSDQSLNLIAGGDFSAESLKQDFLNGFYSAIPDARNDDLTLVSCTF